MGTELDAHIADANRVLNDPCMRGKAVAPMTVRGLLAGIRSIQNELDKAQAEVARLCALTPLHIAQPDTTPDLTAAAAAAFDKWAWESESAQ